MADEYAWKDREMMISLFGNLQRCLDEFKAFARKAEKFKLGVLDHPARLAELMKLINEDPNWTLDDIRAKYDEFKAVYEYLTT